MTTLAGEGAQEFWIVDPATRAVTVHRKTGMTIYAEDGQIPVPGAAAQLAITGIFPDPR